LEEKVKQADKQAGFWMIMGGLALCVIGGGATYYGVADVFLGYKLPMGFLLLLAGPFIIFGGLGILYAVIVGGLKYKRGPSEARTIETSTSLKDVCSSFYDWTFCRGISAAKIGHHFPIPILKL
jgi:hypothetical protein